MKKNTASETFKTLFKTASSAKKLRFLGFFLLALCWLINTGSAQSKLCASGPTTFGYEYVSSVNFNGATKTGDTDFNGPGYFDYSSSILSNVVAGTSYPVTVTVKTNNSFQEYVKIWIDFNNDGNLTEAGKLVMDQKYTFNGSKDYTGNITIPTSAYNGAVYMRVIMVYSQVPQLCGSYTYGNTLDFKLSISGGKTARTLTVTKSNLNGASGDVISSPTGINTATSTNSANFDDASTVSLTATATNASFFTGWSGDVTGNANPITVTMDAAKNVVANFSKSGPPVSGGDVTASYNAQAGNSVSATAATGSTVDWYDAPSGGNLLASGTSSSTTVYQSPAIAAGLYTYYAQSRDNNSGTVSPTRTAVKLTINKAPIAVYAYKKSKVYGTTDPIFTYMITSGSLFGNDQFSGLLSRDPGNSVATYTITQGTLALSSNYNLSYTSSHFWITPANLLATADNQTKVYGQSNPALTITYSGFVNGDNQANANPGSTATSTADATSSVGTYSITSSGGSNPNYTLSYAQGNLVISQAPLLATADNQTIVYGQGNPTLTLTYSGFVNGDNMANTNPGSIATTTAQTGSPVGNYPITTSGGSSTNYTLSYASGNLSITQAPLIATADNQTKVYGQANPTLTLTYSGFVNGDTQSTTNPGSTATTTAQTGSSFGTYPISTSGGATANYSLSYVSGNMKVTQAPLYAILNDMSKVYGQANPTPTLIVTGLVNGDTQQNVMGSFTTDLQYGNSTQVGSDKVTINSITLNSANYFCPSGGSGTLFITPAPLLATADNQTKVYGQTNPLLTITYSGFVNGDTQSSTNPGSIVTTTAQTNSPVGNYPITSSGGSTTNYTLSYASGNLSITQAPLIATADNQTKVYGQANPTLTITYSGYVNGDTQSNTNPGSIATTTAQNDSPAGTYPITTSGGSAPNYTLNYASGIMSVTKAPLLATASNQTRAYGNPNPAFTITYTGYINGDTNDNANPGSTGTTSATSSSAVGTYPVTASGGTSKNYTLSYASGNLFITQAPLTITAFGYNKTYGLTLAGGPNTSGFNSIGLQNNETIGNVTLAFGPGGLGTANAGDYTKSVTASAATGGSFTASNYAITYNPGNIKVLKATLKLFATDISKTYGKTLEPVISATGFTASGLKNNDKIDLVTIIYGIGKLGTAPVGTYFQSVYLKNITGANFNSANYNIDIYRGSVTVNPALLVMEANDQFRIYGQPNPFLKISYTGFVNGEDSTVLTNRSLASTKATASSAASTYAIILPGGTTSPNYTISTFDGNLTIGKAMLVLTPDSKQKVYGQADPAFTINYKGFVNGDLASIFQIQPTIFTTGNKGVSTPAGTYSLTVSNALNPNYVMSYNPGIYTVKQAPLTLTARDTIKNYGLHLDNAIASIAFTTTGLQNLETIGSVQMTYAKGSVATDAAGKYAGSIQPSAATGGTALLTNYTLTYFNGTISVIAITPSMATLSATKIMGTTVTIGTTVTDNGASTTVSLKYSTDPLLKGAMLAVFTTGTSPMSPGSGKTPFISILSGLIPGTTYYYQLSVANSAGSASSTIQSFKTLNNNASLTSIGLGAGSLSPAFSSNVYNYTSTAVSTESNVTLNVVTADQNATVLVNGMSASNTGATNVPLIVGNNTIQIAITAQDGSTQLSYLVTIHRVIALNALIATNILSPNHDGMNDVWIVKDIQYYPNNSVTVYDRLGRIVYTKNGYQNDWGATFHGSLLNEDTYYYLVDFGPGERKMKGFITVVRNQ